MKRRAALKLMGVLVACLGGRAIMAEDNLLIGGDATIMDFSDKVNYCFSENSIRNVIIERSNGNRLEIPFSEICDALET